MDRKIVVYCLLAGLGCWLSTHRAFAQVVTFADPLFEQHCLSRYDTNGDGKLSLTEAAAVTGAMELYSSGVQDLTGLEAFTNLQRISMRYHNISTIPELTPMKATLETIILYNCGITEVPGLTSLVNLKYLDISANYIQNVPDLTGLTKLYSINLGSNQIDIVNPLPSSLRFFYAGNQDLVEMPDLDNLVILEHMSISGTLITTLPDLSALVRIRTMHVVDNALTTLPNLPPGLTRLDIRNNQLTSLPPLGQNLQRLDARDNQLVSLPKLPATLESLDVRNNQLSSLPTLPDGLEIILAEHNQLTSLPALPDNLEDLYVGDNAISELPDLPLSIVELDVTRNDLQTLPRLDHLINLDRLVIHDNFISVLPTLPPDLRYLIASENFFEELPLPLPQSITFFHIHWNLLDELPDIHQALPNLFSLVVAHNLFDETICPDLTIYYDINIEQGNPTFGTWPEQENWMYYRVKLQNGDLSFYQLDCQPN